MPTIAEAVRRVQATSYYRAFVRFRVQRGTRLAAAMTYTAFLSMFPLLAVAAALTAALLGDSGVRRLVGQVTEAVPGLAQELPLDAIVSEAATVGLIGAVFLLWSGLAWVNTARGSMRTIWKIDDMPGRFITRKAVDLAALVGLGLTSAVSVGASVLSFDLVGRILRALGFSATLWAETALWLLGTMLGLAASTALFAYLLSGIPRLRIPRGVLIAAALAGAVAFELAKTLLAAYIGGVAAKSLYGAFGVPVAVMIWFNLTFQAVLYLSAWTATKTEDLLRARAAAAAAAASVQAAPDPAAEGGAPASEGA